MHIEIQARREKYFPERMFRYFVRIYNRHHLPIYPVALFSFESPLDLQPSGFHISFPERQVLSFNYSVVQLNCLDWRAFLDRPNPAAVALMTKMKIAKGEAPYVKFECMQMFLALHLTAEPKEFLAGFVEAYLPLTDAEERVYQELLKTLPQAQQEAIMEVKVPWMEEGKKIGLEQGLQQGLEQGLELASISTKLNDLTAIS